MKLKRLAELFGGGSQKERAPHSTEVALLANEEKRVRSEAPEIRSSWDDLLDGVRDLDDWKKRKKALRERYLELIRDAYKPSRPAAEVKVHETAEVEGVYVRKLISYAVEEGERAHAYLGIPLGVSGRVPGVLALHGTYEYGKECTAGLMDNPDKAYLDHLCRRGYAALAPDHFVSGHRIPREGAYDTSRFYKKHPEWTAVGKSTFENSIGIDVLQSQAEVDGERIGVMGHSLGGHGAYFLAAYDERIRAAACNCGAPFFRHNSEVLEWARDRWYIYLKPIREPLLRGYLPSIDMHEIISLIAPRAFLDLSGLNDGDAAVQRQRVLMNMKLMEVYELEKAAGNFAFYVHGQSHTVGYESRMLMYGWLDNHLKGESATKCSLVRM